MLAGAVEALEKMEVDEEILLPLREILAESTARS